MVLSLCQELEELEEMEEKESLPTTLEWRAAASCAARERAANMAHGGARRSLWLGRQDPETDVKVKLHLRNK